jgi:glyoxylase-like metal-dependent hydrolase (beta-lactamase superfamily II)
MLDEVLSDVWRGVARHPEWTEDEGGDDGWEPEVAWYAVASSDGLVLIDPLVSNWDALDALVAANGGCAGILRTCHWHQRSIPEAALRYGASVWARPASAGDIDEPFDHALTDGQELFGMRTIDIERIDEIGLWLPARGALIFGDAMLRRDPGTLSMCPPSWIQPSDGRERLREILAGLTDLPVEHVLVSHGPLVLGDGLASLKTAVTLD